MVLRHRKLRRLLSAVDVLRGTGADPTASTATRIARSLNFKDKYARDFSRVAICQANLGRMTRAAELERLGLVAAPIRCGRSARSWHRSARWARRTASDPGRASAEPVSPRESQLRS